MYGRFRICKKKETIVRQFVSKIDFMVTQRLTKIKKNKPVLEHYELGVLPIKITP